MMNSKHSSDRAANLWRVVMWSAIAALLLLPVVAMQFTREVNWGAEDFAMAAALLIGGGGLYEVVARLTRDSRRRTAIGIALVAAVLLIWAEAAVGIFH
jgi:hypothetical protein